MRLIPSRPRRIVRSSRVDQPPVSGGPVAGATRRRSYISWRIKEDLFAENMTYKQDREYQCRVRDIRA